MSVLSPVCFLSSPPHSSGRQLRGPRQALIAFYLTQLLPPPPTTVQLEWYGGGGGRRETQLFIYLFFYRYKALGILFDPS